MDISYSKALPSASRPIRYNFAQLVNLPKEAVNIPCGNDEWKEGLSLPEMGIEVSLGIEFLSKDEVQPSVYPALEAREL